MCYSREVSFAAAAVIGTASAWSAWRFLRPGAAVAVPGGGLASNWRGTGLAPGERAFLTHVLLGELCIGAHQLLDGLAVGSGSAAVYKVGLVVSLSCMFFLLRSLERLTLRRYGSRLFALVIALAALHVAALPASFENRHFWVRGNSHALWGFVWILLFMYWNACALHARASSTSAANRRLLAGYPLAVLDLSFVLALGYSFLASLAGEGGLASRLFACAGLVGTVPGHELLKDTPSIWCVFAALQSLLLPFWIARFCRTYEAGAPYLPRQLTQRSRLGLATAAVLASALLYLPWPMVRATAVKMVTK